MEAVVQMNILEYAKAIRDDAIEKKTCPFCGAPVDPDDPDAFTDEKSRADYYVTGLCQDCQDQTFRDY